MAFSLASTLFQSRGSLALGSEPTWPAFPNTLPSSDEVPAFLNRMHEAVITFGEGPPIPPIKRRRQVSARRLPSAVSLASKDHLISLIDGKKYTLSRHLSTHGLTPEQYRECDRLKPDYPMVAQSYSEARRAMAGPHAHLRRRSLRRPERPRRGRKPNAALNPT